MIRLLKCELIKMRRRYVFLSLLAVTAAGLVFSLYGDYSGPGSGFTIKNGWLLFLYQLPLVNGIFFPIAAAVTASRLADAEHKGSAFKQLFAAEKRGRIYDAKLITGLVTMLLSVLIYWVVILVFGIAVGFEGEPPMGLYLRYLACIAAPTAVIYFFQHGLSMLFKNQAASFFAGVIGTFAGVFSMFLPQFPALRNSLPWGLYGAMQFIGLFGWTQETRYEFAYFEMMHTEPAAYAAAAVYAAAFYALGKYMFCRKEI